jgi:hypothetical protein
MRSLKPAMAAAGTVIPGSEGVATRVFKSPGGKPLLVDFRPMGPLLLTRKIQSDSHIPGLFPHQFPGNSQRPKAAREHWRRRGACRMRSTSKTRQFVKPSARQDCGGGRGVDFYMCAMRGAVCICDKAAPEGSPSGEAGQD